MVTLHRRPYPGFLNHQRFCQFESIIDLDAKAPSGAFKRGEL